MKYIKQFGIIMSISFVGEILNNLILLPVPASIYGIVILFLCLEFKLIKIESVKSISSFLIEIMPIMFVPVAVGLMTSWDILKPSLLAYVVITVVTTVLVMASAGLMTQLMIKIGKRGKKTDA